MCVEPDSKAQICVFMHTHTHSFYIPSSCAGFSGFSHKLEIHFTVKFLPPVSSFSFFLLILFESFFLSNFSHLFFFLDLYLQQQKSQRLTSGRVEGKTFKAGEVGWQRGWVVGLGGLVGVLAVELEGLWGGGGAQAAVVGRREGGGGR